MADLCTRAQVKTYLGITDTSADAVIDSLIPSASAQILAALNRLDLTPTDYYTDRICGNGKTRIYLKHYPVSTVSSVTVNDEAIDEWDNTSSGTGWRFIDDDPNPENQQFIELIGSVFTQPFNYCWPYSIIPNIVISYRAGYDDIPPSIVQAAVEFVAFKRSFSAIQVEDPNISSRQIGDYTESFGGKIVTDFMGLSMPQSVKDVIEQYRRFTV
jgi:hypothetical protein